MGASDLLFALLNLLAPAWVVAGFVTLTARWVFKFSPVLTWYWRWVITALAGSAVLVAGLVGLGADGKMVTYGALILVCASSQWLLSRGWRG